MDRLFKVTPRAVFVGLSVLISACVTTASAFLLDTDAATSIIIGLISLIISLQLSEMASSEIERMREREFQLVKSDPVVKDLLLSIASSNNELEKSAKSQAFEECMRDFFVSRLEHTDADLKEICHGRIQVQDTDLERIVTRNLLKIAENEIRATSVYEEAFWNDNDTSIYLDKQKELIRDRGVGIQRIFVFDVQNKPNSFPIEQIKKQIEAGIAVRLLWRNSPVEEDVIIYDDHYVRIGKNIRFGSSLKHLECTANPSVVSRKVNAWEAYWEQSVPVKSETDIEAAIERALDKCLNPKPSSTR